MGGTMSDGNRCCTEACWQVTCLPNVRPGRLPRLAAVFNIGGGELIVILIIALIVLGPDKLPDAVRRAGRLYGELRRMSSGFQAELRDALDEPMREVRSTTDLVKTTFTSGVDAPDDEDTSEPSSLASATADVDVPAPVQGPDDATPAPEPLPAPIGSPAHPPRSNGWAPPTSSPQQVEGDVPVPLPTPAGPPSSSLPPPPAAS
jgi:sec-independent protein translocase protein TatB